MHENDKANSDACVIYYVKCTKCERALIQRIN